MDLSVVIVNYNSKDKALRCIDSIKQSDLIGLSWEIIVVDNASHDGLDSALKDEKNVRFIQAEKNLGMGAGNNLGARAAKGEYLLILNPDTLLWPKAIKVMLEYMRSKPEVGLVGPKLFYPDKTLQYSCLRFPGLLTPFYRRTFLGRFAKKHLADFTMEDYGHKEAMAVDWLMGSCLMISRALFERFGGFDERYFMYFEDTDLCRQVAVAGKLVVYLPEAIVIHDHSRGSANHRWFFAPFTNKLSRTHLLSWIKYELKWRGKKYSSINK